MDHSFTKLASVSFIGRVIGRVFNYLISIIIARTLGADALGAFALGLVILRFGNAVAGFGLGTAAQKYIPRYRSEETSAKLTGFSLLCIVTPLGFGTAIVAVLLGLRRFLSETVPVAFSDPVVTLIMALPAFSLVWVIESATLGFNTTRFSVYIKDLGKEGLGLAFVTVGVLAFGTATAAAAGYSLALVVTGALGIWFLYKLGGFPSLRGPSFDLVEIYSYSASVVLIAASNQLIVWTDILFLSVFVSAGAVGHYQAAYQTSALLTFALVSANTVFPPLASEFCNQGETEMLRELYEVVTKWIVLVTTYAMAFVIVFASDLLSLFGMGFATAQSVLVLLAVSQGVVAAVGPVGYLLSMSEYERVEMINTIVAGLVNVVLNFLLIQRYGILGAAVATGISLALVNGLGLIEIRSIFGFNPFSRLSPQAIAPVGGAIVLMVAISYIDAQPLLRLLIGGTCSLVIFGLLASKYAFGPEDSLLFNAL